MAKARTATPWYETFRVTGRKHGRREERQARAALKHLISATDDGDAVGLQLFGQSMSPGVYERFQPIANQNLRRRRIIQTLPDSRGQTVVIVWGLEAGSEVIPTLSTRDFPDLLGTTVAVHCAGDAPDGPASSAAWSLGWRSTATRRRTTDRRRPCFNAGAATDPRSTRSSTSGSPTRCRRWTSSPRSTPRPRTPARSNSSFS